MKKSSYVIWGIVLLAAGVIIALNGLGVADVELFFDGWWTLFIIVPCTIGLFTEREKTGNLIGIVVGVLLLLSCQEVISFSILWKLLIPAIIIIVGLKFLYTGLFGNKAGKLMNKLKASGTKPRTGCAVFSGCDMHYDGEVFEGAALCAVFGGVECDLRRAVIDKDCALQITAIFGGVDVLVPDHVHVKVNSTCLFGGVSNKAATNPEGPTLYINGVCLFGGAEVK